MLFCTQTANGGLASPPPRRGAWQWLNWTFWELELSPQTVGERLAALLKFKEYQ